MIHLKIDPTLSTKPAEGAFLQTLRLVDDANELGRAAWCATDDAAGVSQLLELWINPAHRRSGHGRRLLSAVIEQCRGYHRSHDENFRRMWVGVGHKQQVVGRSFLTREGFHHIGSACGVMRDQDMLVYVKSLD